MRPGWKRTGQVVSLILNPSLWTGGFLVFLAARIEPVGTKQWLVAGLGLTFTGLVPIAILFALKSKGLLSDIEMSVRTERDVVYKTCAGSYALGAAALYSVRAAWPIWGLVALHVPYSLVLAWLNRSLKVSIHTTGIAGVLAAALVLFGFGAWPLTAVLVAAAWGRWAAGAHTLAELASGAAIGFVLTGGGLALLQRVLAA